MFNHGQRHKKRLASEVIHLLKNPLFSQFVKYLKKNDLQNIKHKFSSLTFDINAHDLNYV